MYFESYEKITSYGFEHEIIFAIFSNKRQLMGNKVKIP